MKSTILNVIFIISLFSLSNSQITFSQESGFYPNEFELTLTASDKIYYTVDGSDPTTSNTAKEYSGPIKVKDRSDEPNIYSDYAEDDNSPISICRGVGYKKPPFLIEKGMVVRAATKNAQGYSKIVEKSYFVTTGQLQQYKDHTVVSLVTNPENLFDPDKGIYVTGTQYINWINSGNFNPGKSVWDTDNICNYFMGGSEWEREASITIFENGKITLEQNVGIRIKGSSTRNSQQKNFNIYARKKYGNNKIKSATLFPDNVDINGRPITEYDSFSLREISEDTRTRDQFSIRLIKDRKLETTYNLKNGVLFLNGEFWGMYALTEKFSDQFFESHYGIPKDDILFIKEQDIKEGTPEEYTKLMNFMDLYAKKDLSDSNNYQEVCNVIDCDSMMEHYATNIYIVTYDWPNHNFGLWKNNGNKIDGNLYSDGKWRFMTYDLDYTIGKTYKSFGGVEGYQYNMFNHMQSQRNYPPTSLFLALLKNKDFKEKFMALFEEYANSIMSTDKTNPIIEEFNGEVTELLCYSQSRWWGYFGGSRLEVIAYVKNNFQNKILPEMKKFFEERSKYALEHLKQYCN
jgi:hypothetical protein